jgi:hypothetical protein
MLSNMQIASSSNFRTRNDLQLIAQALLKKRLDAVFGFSLFFATLTLYVRTLAPSLLEGDSAEFQTLAYTLGIGHPSGYPVYILLAKLFTLIPIHDIAYRVNLFSAFCAALTVALIYLILRKLGARIIASICGALALGVTPLFWKYASIAEVYSSSSACLVLIMLFVLQWKQTDRPYWLFLAGLLGGLSLGMHTTLALSGISILFYLLLSTRRAVDWAQASLGVVTGLVLFLTCFLFLDSLQSPASYYNAAVRPSLSAWDMTSDDFDSPLERLAFLYVLPQFRAEIFSVPSDQVVTRIADFAREASWTLWFALLGLIALILPYKVSPARWREAVLLGGAFLTLLTFAASSDVHDFRVLYIHAIVLLVILFGIGIDTILEAVTLIPRLPGFVPALAGVSIFMVLFYLSATDISAAWRERMPPGLEGWERYYEFPADQRLKTERVVNRLEDNAIVFTGWDKLYTFYYVAHVLQGRTGIDFHETYPQEGLEQLAASAIQYIEANLDARPIYSTNRSPELANYFKLARAASGLFRIERK